MKKFLGLLLCSCWLFLGAAPALAAEISSIDSVTAGVADTGETHYGKSDKDITVSQESYKIAVLPYVDNSGLEGRSREMAANAVKECLKDKYPDKKNAPYTIASAKEVQAALQQYPFENTDAPVLDELVAVGRAMGADRVIYLAMLPVRQKETGVMIIAGTQTYSAVVTMKMKCVDVTAGKYLFNQNVEDIGSSSSVNFWKIGQPSRAKAVKRGTLNCMRDFLTVFD